MRLTFALLFNKARTVKNSISDAWYHVMNRGRRGEKIFVTKEDYWGFVDLLEELNEVFNINIAAYCLMANHYRLLIQNPDENLSSSMRHFRNDTLKQIEKQFGIESYRTVSSIIERVKYEMKLDMGFKERVQNIAEIIDKSQQQT